MDDDFGIDLTDPDFQDKIAEKGKQDIYDGWIGGLICAFFESILSGWLRKAFCAVLLFLSFMSNEIDPQHSIMGPLLGFAGASLIGFSTPASSLLINILGRVIGAVLLQVIGLTQARLADRSAAFKGAILLQLEPLVALAVVLVFRLSVPLGIIVCGILPALSFIFIPLTQIFLAIVKHFPYPIRWLMVLPLRVFDKCNRWLQYSMLPSFYRLLERIEHDQLQDASKLLLRHPVYQYTPLTSRGHFRVLVVERRRLFRPPKCRLEVETLDRSSAHIACSYVWGDATRCKPISIGPFRLDVTESAYNVVRHQQSFWAERRIWIDAICINQADLEEKAVQIEHMGQIYGHALWVDGYLKFGNEDSDLWVLIYDLMNKEAIHRALGASDHDLIYQEHLEPYWGRLFDLLTSPWFNRMWVMQEIMLAGDLYLHYGQVKLTWPLLRCVVEAMDTAVLRGTFAARYLFNKQQAETANLSTPLRLVITRGILKHRHESLYTLLRFFREQKATDPRDKVYGLLSLAPSNVRTFLGPAYQVTLRELLVRTMRYLILQEGLLCLLSCHQEPNHPLADDLPSWVTNWCVDGQALGKPDVPSWRAATRIRARPLDIQSCPITSEMLPVRMMPAMDRVGETVAISVRLDNITIESADELNVQIHAWLSRSRNIVLRSTTRTDPETVAKLKGAFYRTITYDHGDPDNETTLLWSHPNFESDIDFLEEWYNVGGDLAKSRVMRDQRRLERILQPLVEKTGMSIRHLRQEFSRGNVQLLKGLKEVPAIEDEDEDEDEDNSHKKKTPTATGKEWHKDIERFMKIQERLKFSTNRRTGVTASGRVGSFPLDAQEGDEICLIAGAPAPFVVRKVAAELGSRPERDRTGGSSHVNEAQRYRLVGWCYLHGGMDGSLATGPWTDAYLV